MRKIIILLVLVAGTMSANAQNKNEAKAEIKSSVVCPMCQRTIEYDLTFAKGVKSVNVDLDKRTIEVVYNTKKTDIDKLRERITMIGYDADSLKRNKEAYINLPDCCQTDKVHNDGKKHEDH